MEVAAQPAHRQEEIRRQEDHEEAGRERKRPCRESACGKNDSECGSAVCQKVHDDYGVELHGEHLHGHHAKALRLLVHLLILEGVRLVDLKGRHSLQVLQEAASKLCILIPIFCQDFLGDLLHHHDRARDQRDTQKKNQSRLQASCSREEDEQSDRRDKRVEELRHILAKIALQLVYSFH